jgi:hypothetical protein
MATLVNKKQQDFELIEPDKLKNALNKASQTIKSHEQGHNHEELTKPAFPQIPSTNMKSALEKVSNFIDKTIDKKQEQSLQATHSVNIAPNKHAADEMFPKPSRDAINAASAAIANKVTHKDLIKQEKHEKATEQSSVFEPKVKTHSSLTEPNADQMRKNLEAVSKVIAKQLGIEKEQRVEKPQNKTATLDQSSYASKVRNNESTEKPKGASR